MQQHYNCIWCAVACRSVQNLMIHLTHAHPRYYPRSGHVYHFSRNTCKPHCLPPTLHGSNVIKGFPAHDIPLPIFMSLMSLQFWHRGKYIYRVDAKRDMHHIDVSCNESFNKKESSVITESRYGRAYLAALTRQFYYKHARSRDLNHGQESYDSISYIICIYVNNACYMCTLCIWEARKHVRNARLVIHCVQYMDLLLMYFAELAGKMAAGSAMEIAARFVYCHHS